MSSLFTSELKSCVSPGWSRAGVGTADAARRSEMITTNPREASRLPHPESGNSRRVPGHACEI